MAFEEVEIGEAPVGKYWKPEKTGDNIEGNIYDFVDDNYGKKRIELLLGEDEYGEPITTILPSHTNLLRFYKNLEEGDYIKVELKEIIPPKEGKKYPFHIYKVLKDPDRKLYAEDDGDVEPEVVR